MTCIVHKMIGCMILSCVCLCTEACTVPMGESDSGKSRLLIIGFGFIEKDSGDDSVAGATHSVTLGSEIELKGSSPTFVNVGYARRSQVFVKKGVEDISIERTTYKINNENNNNIENDSSIDVTQ